MFFDNLWYSGNVLSSTTDRGRLFAEVEDALRSSFPSRLGGIRVSLSEYDWRTEDNISTLELPLPGFTKEEIKVSVDEDYLVVHAKQVDNEDKARYKAKETKLSVCIPKSAVLDTMTSRYENGVLCITVETDDRARKLDIPVS